MHMLALKQAPHLTRRQVKQALVPGEIIARFIPKTVALVEAILGDLVSLTGVSGKPCSHYCHSRKSRLGIQAVSFSLR